MTAPCLSSASTLTQPGDDCFGEDFEDAARRAQEDGVDLFASAPIPTFCSTAGERLHPPHGRGSGMIYTEIESRRLSTCLAQDYFAKPCWDKSMLVPRDNDVDYRSLETVAREQREEVMEDYLRRARKKDQRKLRDKSSIGGPEDSCRFTPKGSQVSAMSMSCVFKSPHSGAAISEAAATAAAIRRELAKYDHRDAHAACAQPRRCGSPVCNAIKETGGDVVHYHHRRRRTGDEHSVDTGDSIDSIRGGSKYSAATPKTPKAKFSSQRTSDALSSSSRPAVDR